MTFTVRCLFVAIIKRAFVMILMARNAGNATAGWLTIDGKESLFDSRNLSQCAQIQTRILFNCFFYMSKYVYFSIWVGVVDVYYAM